MKKLIFAVLVVLLAMLAVTCDSAVLPGTLSTGAGDAPPPAEPKWVTISLNVGDASSRSRAVDSTSAASTADLYEAVFVYEGAITRSIKPPSGDWTVNVQTGDYGDTGNVAVIFAGKSGMPNVLLGIGEISTVNGSTSKTIVDPDDSVLFLMESIKSGVSKTLSASKFKITAPSSHVLASGPIPGGPSTPVDHSAYPAFRIPTKSNAITATYTFSSTKLGHVAVTGPATVDVGEVDDGVDDTITTLVTAPAAAGADFSNGEVSFGITTNSSGTQGLAKLSIAVPVVAYSSGPGLGTTATQWFIQGGLDNDELDDGTIAGGAVLINVEDPSAEVSIGDNTDSVAADFDEDTSILKYVLSKKGESASDDIILTASFADFTPVGDLVWKVAAGESPAPGTDLAATTINGVVLSGEKDSILTLESTSTALTAGAVLRFYCVGDDNGTLVPSTIITIMVQSTPSVPITIGPVPGDWD